MTLSDLVIQLQWSKGHLCFKKGWTPYVKGTICNVCSLKLIVDSQILKIDFYQKSKALSLSILKIICVRFMLIRVL